MKKKGFIRKGEYFDSVSLMIISKELTQLEGVIDSAVVMGTKENKDILIDFLNAILEEEHKIKDLHLKNPYNLKTYRFDKGSIMDIKAQDEYGRWLNIEMQIADQEYYDKRALLYYWARMYVGQYGMKLNLSGILISNQQYLIWEVSMKLQRYG